MQRSLALGTLFLAACSGSDTPAPTEPGGTQTTRDVRTLSGRIEREGGDPLAGVTVRSAGGDVAVSQDNGWFVLAGQLDSVLQLEFDGTTANIAGSSFPRLTGMASLGDAADVLLEQVVVLPDLASSSAARVEVPLDSEGRAASDFAGLRQSMDLGLEGSAGTRLAGGSSPAVLTLSASDVRELPLPAPPDRLGVSAFFLDPEELTIAPPISVRLPDPLGLPPDTPVSLLRFDPTVQDWVAVGGDGTARARREGGARWIEAPGALEQGGWHVATLPVSEGAESTAPCRTTLVGQVVDVADGSPLAGVLVEVAGAGARATNADGRFRFEGVVAVDPAAFAVTGDCSPATLEFVVTSPIALGGVQQTGAIASTEVVLGGTTRLFGDGPLEIAVTDTGSVAGLLEGPLDTERPVSLLRQPGSGFATGALPSESGAFFAGGLEPGAYLVSYRFEGDDDHSERLLEVGPGFLTTVLLARAPGGPLEAPLELSYSDPAPTYAPGAPIQANRPTVSGPVDAFSVEPATPTGLRLDPVTGVLSGVPEQPLAATLFVVTAANGAGSTSAQLVIAVGPEPPSDLVYAGLPATLVAGVPIAALQPTVTGAVGAFSVEPALPIGLELDSATGALSGMPRVAALPTDYTVTAANSSGATTAVLSFEVLPPAAPLSLAYAPNPVRFVVGQPAESVPIVDGFADSFTIAPALPAGLELDTTTGVVSGTPLATAAALGYVVSASNVTGAVDHVLTLSVSAALASGRIVVNHDEHTLKNAFFNASAQQFLANVADWFTDGQPGAFLVLSGNGLVAGSSAQTFMENLGHTWTVDSSFPQDTVALQQFDGVLVCLQPCVDAQVLIDYVEAGGNVYVAGGVSGGDPSCWNPFLQHLGLGLGSLGLNFSNLQTAHPLLHGVSTLGSNNGNRITDEDLADGRNRVIVRNTGNQLGLLAVFDGRFHETALRYETYATVPFPVQLSFDDDGTLYVGQDEPEVNSVPIHRVAVGGEPVEAFGPAMLDPDGVAVDRAGIAGFGVGAVVVANGGPGACGGHLLVIDPVDQSQHELIPASSQSLGNPSGVLFSGDGRLLITSDGCNFAGSVLVSDPPGSPPAELISAPELLGRVALDDNGSLFVGDELGQVRKFDLAGTEDNAFGTVQPALLTGNSRGGLALGPDTAPWNGDLFLASQTGLVRRVSENGAMLEALGATIGPDVADIKFGPDGALYASILSDGRILRITPAPETALVDFQVTGVGEGGSFPTMGLLTVTGEAALEGGPAFGFGSDKGNDLGYAPPFSDPGNLFLAPVGGAAQLAVSKTFRLDFASEVTQVSFVVGDLDASSASDEELTVTALGAGGEVLHQFVLAGLPNAASDGGVRVVDFGALAGIRSVALRIENVLGESAGLGIGVDDVRYVPVGS